MSVRLVCSGSRQTDRQTDGSHCVQANISGKSFDGETEPNNRLGLIHAASFLAHDRVMSTVLPSGGRCKKPQNFGPQRDAINKKGNGRFVFRY